MDYDENEYERILSEGNGVTDYFPVRVTNIKWKYGDSLPSRVTYMVGDFAHNCDGNPNRVIHFRELVAERILDNFGELPESFDIRSELEELGKPKGPHYVEYFWRGDNEDTEYYAFKTADEAMEFVKWKVKARADVFDMTRKKDDPKTSIDLDSLIEKLLKDGKATCCYCQNDAWWDNWFYWNYTECQKPTAEAKDTNIPPTKAKGARSLPEGVVDKIAEHYNHAREKHPDFADKLLYNTSPISLALHYEASKLAAHRGFLKNCEENKSVSAEAIVNCEFAEAVYAIASKDDKQAVEEVYDTIAALLRIVDVIEGRQKLGKEGETK